jgi:hypothetical protein
MLSDITDLCITTRICNIDVHDRRNNEIGSEKHTDNNNNNDLRLSGR